MRKELASRDVYPEVLVLSYKCLRKELASKGDLVRMEAKMDTGFAETKVEIVKWVAALLIAQAALIAALVKYFW